MAPWYSLANHWGGGEFTVIILPVSAFFLNEQTMNQLNLIPGHLKEGGRVKMKKSVPHNLDDIVYVGEQEPSEYYKGTILSVNIDEALIQWDGELLPCTTSRKHYNNLIPE